jgi:hypothetical protein
MANSGVTNSRCEDVEQRADSFRTAWGTSRTAEAVYLEQQKNLYIEQICDRIIVLNFFVHYDY